MEIKIHCDCGQRYKLEVEPVNGLMPFTVNCPACGMEGTQKGNELIQQALASPPVQPPAAASPRIRLNLSTDSHATDSHAGNEPQSPVAPPVFPGRLRTTADSGSAIISPRKPSFGMGLLGGLAGALVGAAIYCLIIKAAGYRINFLAIGVGGLAGWMANLLGKGEGSKELAGITGVLTVACVIGAQYLYALGLWHGAVGAHLGASAYDRGVQQARQAVKLVPHGTDEEIRNYLAMAQADEGDQPNPAAVTDDAIKQFRDTQLPGLRDLAAGKVTRDQFYSQAGIDPKQEEKEKTDEEGTFKGVFLLILVTRSNIFSLAAAAALAFKLSANA